MNIIKHEYLNLEAHYEYKGNGGYLFPVIEIICNNHNMEFAKMQTESGVLILKKQCFECGEVSSNQFKKSSVNNFDLLPFINDDIRSIRNEFNSEVRKELNAIQNESAWKEYSDYLNSDKWKRKREAVLKRDNNLCQACLSSQATEVHHLHYENIYDEPLFDLVSLCKRCHDKIEDKKKAKRGY